MNETKTRGLVVDDLLFHGTTGQHLEEDLRHYKIYSPHKWIYLSKGDPWIAAKKATENAYAFETTPVILITGIVVSPLLLERTVWLNESQLRLVGGLRPSEYQRLDFNLLKEPDNQNKLYDKSELEWRLGEAMKKLEKRLTRSADSGSDG